VTRPPWAYLGGTTRRGDTSHCEGITGSHGRSPVAELHSTYRSRTAYVRGYASSSLVRAGLRLLLITWREPVVPKDPSFTRPWVSTTTWEGPYIGTIFHRYTTTWSPGRSPVGSLHSTYGRTAYVRGCASSSLVRAGLPLRVASSSLHGGNPWFPRTPPLLDRWSRRTLACRLTTPPYTTWYPLRYYIT
jgi:hypothetical protein